MLKIDSHIKIELYKDMNAQHYASLNLLYLPLIKEQAFLLYTSLIALKNSELPITNHLLLQKTCGLSVEAMEKARNRLEEFLLLRTFYNEKEDTYMYVLDVPMKSSQFLSHEVFGRLFTQDLGEDVLLFYKQNLVTKRSQRSGYQEISATMQDTLKHHWDDAKEKAFLTAKEEIEEISYGFLNVIFDEKLFLSDLNDMVFPRSERTKKNLRTIAEIATIYGINETMMKMLIARGMNLPEKKFNAQKLKNVCMKTKAKYALNEKDPFTMPPTRFLEYKQNGVAIAKADQILIEKLISEYRLQPEVINVLLETGLLKDKDNPRIVGTDIERMAGSWLRLKIDTFEKAKQQQKVELDSVNQRIGKVKQSAIVQEWKKEEDRISEEQKAELINKIRNRGKKDA